MNVMRCIPLALFGLAACAGDGSGPMAARGRIALAVSSRQPAAAATSATLLLNGDSTVVAAEPDTVIVRSVELVVRRIKLEPVAVSGCESDSLEDEHDEEQHDTAASDDTMSEQDDHGCEEIKAGPALVSLPLGTTAIDAMVDVSAPAGQYDKLEFKIHAPRQPRDSTFLKDNPTFEGVSIRVTGTFSHAGTRSDFTYESSLQAEQEVPLDPPITVDAGGTASVTLRFDISGWFAGPGGSGLVDPASANAGGTNAELVESNIRHSINAFEDEDDDGHDDHDMGDDSDGGHGGDGMGGH